MIILKNILVGVGFALFFFLGTLMLYTMGVIMYETHLNDVAELVSQKETTRQCHSQVMVIGGEAE